MKFVTHTNLDLDHREKWPKELPELPRVGERIFSAHTWKVPGDRIGRILELEVVQVVWKPHDIDEQGNFKTWIAHLELHLPRGRWETLITFYEWYGEITGRGRGAFI